MKKKILQFIVSFTITFSVGIGISFIKPIIVNADTNTGLLSYGNITYRDTTATQIKLFVRDFDILSEEIENLFDEVK